MVVSGSILSTFALAFVFLQLGGTPIWVPLVIVLLIILLFWWGLTRNQITATEIEESTAEHHDDSEGIAARAESTESHEPATTTSQPEDQEDQPVSTETPDDLQIIEGIGPKISSILAEAGIVTFAQLADMDSQTLEKIVVEDAGIKLANPATWPKQAELAAAGQWETLEKLQEELHGGLERK